MILLHDGGGDRSETVAALAPLLTVLRERGYSFVTLDTLFGLAAGHPPLSHHRTTKPTPAPPRPRNK